MPLEHEEMTRSLIGAAIAVHRALGPGFLESVYAGALALELGARGLSYERERSVPVVYRGVEVGTHRLDLLVAGEIVVELKAVKDVTDSHFAVVRSYLRAVGREHGVILNFAKPKLEAKRVIVTATPRARSAPPRGRSR
ncbi:GxxExxY protein [Sandaracinus amylolyticus]|uniref:GxxExxY protein n=1 Tax=Sandaracinus amylolyticus TaxID=927083 RepID=A0A0F6W199_9BACT|nr:GxxExxY protein [Sandaracinus amylolyticus]AKF04727.1 hypothetical protein DB32_001876 [Sandaracinus amylolyticus]